VDKSRASSSAKCLLTLRRDRVCWYNNNKEETGLVDLEETETLVSKFASAALFPS
jgi:hypothetical protein